MERNIYCPSCEYRIREYQYTLFSYNKGIRCGRCETNYDTETAIIRLDKSCEKFLDIDTVKDSVWYHVTTTDPSEWRYETSANWYYRMTHVGTHLTTNDYRCYNLKREKVRTLSFRIKPEAKVCDYIVNDFNNWMTHEDAIRFGKYDVLRYINRYEGPGQISLLVNPAVLEMVKVG